MAVQSYATLRNAQVEVLVDYVLRMFVSRLHAEGWIKHVSEPLRQVAFQRDDCSDRFDHYVELELTSPVGELSGTIQLWGQTTCYKGNQEGKPEPNKTYEVRESLIEALGLRRWLHEEGAAFRTLHFTVGPEKYTYPWFAPAKNSSFDLSLYPDDAVDCDALFAELALLPVGEVSESAIYTHLDTATLDSGSMVGVYIKATLAKLLEWFFAGMPSKPMADMQAGLLDALRSRESAACKRALENSKKGGADIKPRAAKLLRGENDADPALARALARLLARKPFLTVALKALADWSGWANANLSMPAANTDLEEYIEHLWLLPLEARMIVRRLLLRIHTAAAVNYVQDLGISGLDEHNLYAGNHNSTIVSAVAHRITNNCRGERITSASALRALLAGKRGQEILRASFRLEGVNGTALTPSIWYVEESLADAYVFRSFRDAGLLPPRAYHAAFAPVQVDPYDSPKVIVSRATGRPLAIIKGKFFNAPEFPRRCKEEAYVALTMRYDFTLGKFTERYKHMPMIMFVDMAAKTVPPEYAVRRLVSAGWEAVFSVEELRSRLKQLEDEEMSYA